jgi:hypothetical protein
MIRRAPAARRRSAAAAQCCSSAPPRLLRGRDGSGSTPSASASASQQAQRFSVLPGTAQHTRQRALMNTAIFEAGPLEVELFQVREVLRCALRACARARLLEAADACAGASPRTASPRDAGVCMAGAHCVAPCAARCLTSACARAGLLHTVLFHRALGVVRPKDVQLSLFDVIFVR